VGRRTRKYSGRIRALGKRAATVDSSPTRRRLRFEPLEDRRMLSITVTTTSDVVDVNDGVTSLREAIFAANTVSGADTIDFAPALTANGPATILLTQGELPITDALTITGPGANLLTIDASGDDPTPNVMHGDGTRIFNIDDGSSTTLRVEIDGLSMKGGDVTGSGGAVVNREDLTLQQCSISGNTASVNGGAIYSQFGSLSINGSTLQANRATGSGGQVWLYTSPLATSTISSSLMEANPTGGQGRALYVSDGATHINNSTFIVNSADTGLVYLNASENAVTISSCTLSCIFGVDIVAAHPQVLSNTIVSTNISVSQGTSLNGTFNADYCLITNPGTGTIKGSNNIIGQSSGIATFADYGGPTQMFGLIADSPAVNAGDPASAAGVGDTPLFDQRGANYSRVVGGRIDIGAYEWQNTGAPLSLVVDTASDDLDYDLSAGHLSLREAISLANANAGLADTISFAPGLDGGRIVLTRGELDIADSVTIDASALPHGLTIDASGNDPTPEVRDGKGSRVSYFGGRDLMSKEGALNLIGLTLTGADTYSQGGAIFTQGNLLVRGCTITGNSAGDGGGVNVYSRADVKVQIENTTISNNRTTGGTTGGGLYLVANNGHIEISNCYVIDNHATDYGGGIFANPRNAGSIQIENSVVANNGVDLVYYAGRKGGGIYAFMEGGEFVVSASKISGNLLTGQSVDGGGGICVDNNGGNARVENTLVQGNRVLNTGQVNPSGFGGGLDVRNAALGAVTIWNTTIADNSSNMEGGGVYLQESSGALKIDVSNCTISGNSSNISGGGIFVGYVSDGSPALSISHSTITNNTSDADRNGSGAGGGIYFSRTNVNPLIDESIVAANIDPTGVAPDVRIDPMGAPITVRFSLIGGPAMLGPLVYNGGPTFLDGTKLPTQALLPGSPAINAGDPAAVAGANGVPQFDERGTPFTRVFGGRIDIGAIESQPNPLPGDYNFDGVVDAADYIVWRATLGATNDLRADGNGNSIVDNGDYTFWQTHFGNTFAGAAASSTIAAAVMATESAVTQSSVQPTAVNAAVSMRAPSASHVMSSDDVTEQSTIDNEQSPIDPPSAIGNAQFFPRPRRVDAALTLRSTLLAPGAAVYESALPRWLVARSGANRGSRDATQPVHAGESGEATSCEAAALDQAFEALAVRL
jgi:CSLREA domain-containing protein